MRVAALYDIHGMADALGAVLADVERADVDAIVVGGDTVGGPQPAETMALLRTSGVPLHWIRGNGDRALGEDGATGADAETLAFTVERLDPADRAFLTALPEQLELDVEGLGPVLFCHGTPRKRHRARHAGDARVGAPPGAGGRRRRRRRERAHAHAVRPARGRPALAQRGLGRYAVPGGRRRVLGAASARISSCAGRRSTPSRRSAQSSARDGRRLRSSLPRTSGRPSPARQPSPHFERVAAERGER